MKSHTVKKIVLTIISPNISFLAGQVECGCVAGHIWGRRRRRSVNSVLFHQILQISCSFLATEVESGCVAGQIWGRRRRRSVNSVPDISDRQPVAPAPPSNRKGILFLPQTFGMLPDFGTSFLPVFKYNCFAFFLIRCLWRRRSARCYSASNSS